MLSDSLMPVKAAPDSDLYGLMAPSGRWAIEPRYEVAQGLEDGLVAAKQDGRWGLADEEGN